MIDRHLFAEKARFPTGEDFDLLEIYGATIGIFRSFRGVVDVTFVIDDSWYAVVCGHGHKVQRLTRNHICGEWLDTEELPDHPVTDYAIATCALLGDF
jgi:hypothetical protein